MKMNRVEKLLLNNPLRDAIQKRFEAPLFVRLGGDLHGKSVLEVGCGRGTGVRLAFEVFGVESVCAIDLDLEMLMKAHRRLTQFAPHSLALLVADVTAIPVKSSSFDAVFDYGVLHHVPMWQSAVAEIRRVLKPGGLLFFEEFTRRGLNRWAYRTFLDHPTFNRFNTEDLIDELEKQGITIGDNFVERVFRDFVIGVGQVGETVE